MHNRSILLTLACVLVAFALLASAGCNRPSGGDAQTRQELQARYDSMNNAIKDKNLKAAMEPVAENFQITLADGKRMDRFGMETQMSDAFKLGDATTTTKMGDINASGTQAVVVATSVMAGSYTDSKGQKHSVDATSTSKDTWQKTDKGWFLVSSVETERNTKLDGKPVTRLAATPGAAGTPSSPTTAASPVTGKAPTTADSPASSPSETLDEPTASPSAGSASPSAASPSAGSPTPATGSPSAGSPVASPSPASPGNPR